MPTVDQFELDQEHVQIEKTTDGSTVFVNVLTVGGGIMAQGCADSLNEALKNVREDLAACRLFTVGMSDPPWRIGLIEERMGTIDTLLGESP